MSKLIKIIVISVLVIGACYQVPKTVEAIKEKMETVVVPRAL